VQFATPPTSPDIELFNAGDDAAVPHRFRRIDDILDFELHPEPTAADTAGHALLVSAKEPTSIE
jgi:hypothetical protein